MTKINTPLEKKILLTTLATRNYLKLTLKEIMMSINYFGKKVREARKQTNHTLMTMAAAMDTTPGFCLLLKQVVQKSRTIG